MTPRWITVTPNAQIHEVTNLYDRFGNDTTDPALAATCVIHYGKSQWIGLDADDVPIYTVH